MDIEWAKDGLNNQSVAVRRQFTEKKKQVREIYKLKAGQLKESISKIATDSGAS
jgi:hypothetical protein